MLYHNIAKHPFNGLHSNTCHRKAKNHFNSDVNEAADDGALGWQWHLAAAR